MSVAQGFIIVMIASLPAFSTANERRIVDRIAAREFPSVFQAWSPVENIPDANALERIAKHDLAWSAISLCGLRWDGAPSGLAEAFTPASIAAARATRKKLLALNPNLILIAEIRYRDAHRSFLPEGHPWWLRDENGQIVKGWEEGNYLCLDFGNEAFQQHVARRAKAVIDSGVADGVLLDWWHEDERRLALVQEIRAAIGEEALIIGNSNDQTAPLTAPYINGFFMECYRSATVEDWQRLAATLSWAERHLRRPHVNCIEVWYHQSRSDLNLMRAVTALSLTHSDGYGLFSDPNPLPTPDHLHNWYPFWDKGLGRPVTEGVKRPDGATQREFDEGTVIYNPMGNRPIQVTFDEPHTSRATGRRSNAHPLAPCDGDIYLRATTP